MTTLSESWPTDHSGLTGDLTWVLPVSQQGGVTNAWSVVGGKAHIDDSSISGFCPAQPTSALATDDYQVTVQISSPAFNNLLIFGLIARKADTGTTATDCNYYQFIFVRYDSNPSGQRCYWEIDKVVNNTGTMLAQAFVADGTMPAGGAGMKFVVDGTTLTGYWDTGQVVQATDSTFTTGKYAGIIGARWLTGDSFLMDTWTAADVVTLPTAHFTVGTPVTMKTGGALLAAFGVPWPDTGVGVLNNGDGTYRFFSGLRTGIGQAVGTFSDPLSVSSSLVAVSGVQNAPDGNAPFDWGPAGGMVYKDPASGRWLCITHTERWLSGNWQNYYSWLGIVTSTNSGATWTDCGAIISPHVSFADMQTYYTANGLTSADVFAAEISWGPFLVVGDYLYVYYACVDGSIVNPGGLTAPTGMGVARALLADVLSAAASATVPTFHKYNAGTWTELGLGGTGTAVLPTNHVAVCWNTWRNRGIAMQAFLGYNALQTTFTADYWDSVDGITWTSLPQEVVTAGAGTPYRIYWSLLDSAATVSDQCGETFDLVARDTANDNLVRWPITLDATDHVAPVNIEVNRGAWRGAWRGEFVGA